jgi:hypothetical protein
VPDGARQGDGAAERARHLHLGASHQPPPARKPTGGSRLPNLLGLGNESKVIHATTEQMAASHVTFSALARVDS